MGVVRASASGVLDPTTSVCVIASAHPHPLLAACRVTAVVSLDIPPPAAPIAYESRPRCALLGHVDALAYV